MRCYYFYCVKVVVGHVFRRRFRKWNGGCMAVDIGVCVGWRVNGASEAKRNWSVFLAHRFGICVRGLTEAGF